MYFSHMIKVLLPFFLFPIIARSITVEEFGLFTLYQTLTIVVSCVVEFGFAFCAVSEIASSKFKDQENNIVRQVQFAKILLVIIVLLFSIIYAFVKSDSIVIVSVLSGCISGFTPNYYCQAKELFKNITKAEIWGMAIYYFASVLALHLGFGVNCLVLSYLVSRVVVFIILCGVCFEDNLFGFGYGFNLPTAVRYLKCNLIYFFHRSSVVAYSTFSVFVVANFLGKAELGLYSSAEKLVLVACGFIQPFQQILLPYLSKNQLNIKLQLLIITILIIFILVALVSQVTSKYVFDIYYGEALSSGYKYFNFLIWLLPLRFINAMVFTIFFLSRNNAKPLSAFYTKIVPVFILSSIALVHVFGVTGLIACLMMFELTLLLFSVYKIKNEKLRSGNIF